MGGISSLVGIRMHILGKQFTVFVHACCKVEFDRMTGPGVAESFFSADIQFDWSAANLRGQKGIQRFIENVLLISETSADIRLDDTYIASRDSQCLADDTADDMRDLCGSHYYDPALFHVSIGNWILDMTVLDDRGLIRSPDNCL